MGNTVQPEHGALIAVGAVGPHVLLGDLWAIPHDVSQCHGMPATEPVLIREPFDDLPGFGLRSEAASVAWASSRSLGT